MGSGPHPSPGVEGKGPLPSPLSHVSRSKLIHQVSSLLHKSVEKAITERGGFEPPIEL